MAKLTLYLGDKIVREIKEIPELFCKAGFKKDTDVYKQIEKITAEQNISVSTILDTPKDDIIEILELETEDDINKFVIMRAVLRKADIIKRPQIDIDDTKKLTWDQVCQFFEQHIGSSNVNETVTWYTYFEDHSIKGPVLQTIKLDSLSKNLKLTIGQQLGFKQLLKKIQPKKKSGNNSKSMKNSGGIVGAMVMDSATVNARDFKFNEPSKAGAKKSSSSSSSDDTAGSEESSKDDSSD